MFTFGKRGMWKMTKKLNDKDNEYLDKLIDQVEGDSHPGTGGNYENKCIRCRLVDYLRNFKEKENG